MQIERARLSIRTEQENLEALEFSGLIPFLENLVASNPGSFAEVCSLQTASQHLVYRSTNGMPGGLAKFALQMEGVCNVTLYILFLRQHH
jgi:hypothetical protein